MAIIGSNEWMADQADKLAPGSGTQAKETIDAYSGAMMGNSKQSGLLGMGQRKADRYTIDGAAGQNQNNAYWQKLLQQGAAAAGQRAAPMASAAQAGAAAMFGGANINQGPQAQFRQGQTSLVEQLQAQANGTGPSLAQGQLKQATDRNMAQALSLQAAGSPYGGGAGMRQIAAQRGAMGQQAAADSSQMRLQEQLQAQNQLGQVLAGARGQDIGLAVEQAGMQQQAGLANQGALNQFELANTGFRQQTGLANQSAQMQQTQMNDMLTQFYTSQGMNLDEANRKAAMDMQNMQLQGSLGYEGIDNAAYSGAAGNRVNQSQFFITQLQKLLGATGQGMTAAATGGSPPVP